MGEGRKTALLVEDEAIIAMSEARELEGVGFKVIKAFSGEAAIEAVETAGGNIDIILMDIDLGAGMYGTDAAREILRRHDIPVLFLSSHTEPAIVELTEEITNYGYVVKASSFTVLHASMKMALKLFEAQRRINRINMDFEAANEELRQSLESLQRSNEELAQSEDKFAKAFRVNPDAINLNRLSDGMYLDINDGFTKIMGYTREDVIGRSSLPGDLGIWVRPEDREALVRGLRERGEMVNLEAEFRKKDGSTTTGIMSARIVEINGERCIISITKDMGSYKNLERHLDEAERRFRAAFEDSPVPISLTGPDGRMLMVNEAFCEMLGRTQEELGGTDFVMLTCPADRELSVEWSRRLLAGEARTAHFEKRYVHKDGRDVRAYLDVVLFRDAAGQPDFFMAFALPAGPGEPAAAPREV